MVSVGEFGPHKGFAEAFAVAAGLADRGLPHRVLMVGSIAPWYRAEVEGLVVASARPDRIELAGFVDDLVATYQGASALIMTSRHEGFGLPLVEAMACGTPVVAFDNSSIPEVVGAGGTIVPDGDHEAMADVLEELFGDSERWLDASTAAIQRSKEFDWIETTRIHAQVFRAAARR